MYLLFKAFLNDGWKKLSDEFLKGLTDIVLIESVLLNYHTYISNYVIVYIKTVCIEVRLNEQSKT